jgi:hypothetical protein
MKTLILLLAVLCVQAQAAEVMVSRSTTAAKEIDAKKQQKSEAEAALAAVVDVERGGRGSGAWRCHLAQGLGGAMDTTVLRFNSDADCTDIASCLKAATPVCESDGGVVVAVRVEPAVCRFRCLNGDGLVLSGVVKCE